MPHDVNSDITNFELIATKRPNIGLYIILISFRFLNCIQGYHSTFEFILKAKFESVKNMTTCGNNDSGNNSNQLILAIKIVRSVN